MKPMGFFHKIFGRKTEDSSCNEREQENKGQTNVFAKSSQHQSKNEANLVLGSSDLMKMAQKLLSKGEYSRAELLIRDGVREVAAGPDIWWFLLKIEEPLNRIGRVLYCVEQLLTFEPDNEELIKKQEQLMKDIDRQLSYFIEYKLAAEFFKLK